MLGVVTQSPAPGARDQYARRHRVWRESWFFCGGRKTGEPGEKPSESDRDQPITAHVWAQDRTRVAVVGGVDDDHWSKLTPQCSNSEQTFPWQLLFEYDCQLHGTCIESTCVCVRYLSHVQCVIAAILFCRMTRDPWGLVLKLLWAERGRERPAVMHGACRGRHVTSLALSTQR